MNTALREEYTGLIDRDVPALYEAGDTVTLRFEVNRSAILSNTKMLTGFAVAGIPAQRVPGERANVSVNQEDAEGRSLVAHHRLVRVTQQDPTVEGGHRGCEGRREVHQGMSRCPMGGTVC